MAADMCANGARKFLTCLTVHNTETGVRVQCFASQIGPNETENPWYAGKIAEKKLIFAQSFASEREKKRGFGE